MYILQMKSLGDHMESASRTYMHLFLNKVQRKASHISFGLRLCALPRGKMNFHLSANFEMIARGEEFEKINRQSASIELMEKDLGTGAGDWWIHEMLPLSDLLLCNSLVFKIDIKSHGDEDDAKDQMTIDYWKDMANHQSNEHRSNEETKEISFDHRSMEERMGCLESQSAQILDIVSNLNEQMIEMKRGLIAIQNTNSIDNNNKSQEAAEELKLKKWMESEVKLPQYFELLIENGFEDMESIKDITMDHLRDMGIDKIGHRLKFMKSVAALKASDTP